MTQLPDLTATSGDIVLVIIRGFIEVGIGLGCDGRVFLAASGHITRVRKGIGAGGLAAWWGGALGWGCIDWGFAWGWWLVWGAGGVTGDGTAICSGSGS